MDLLSRRLDRHANRATRAPEAADVMSRLLDGLASPFGVDYSDPSLRAGADELRERGIPLDGRHALIPWDVLSGKRDQAVTTGAAGGYLAGATAVDFAQSLRKFSVVIDAGARVVNLPYGTLGAASFSTPLTASFVATEGDALAESDPVVAGAAGSQHILATPPVDVSRRLIKHVPNIGQYVSTEIETALGKGIDAAALNGSGSSGEPTGALVASGTISVSGTTLAQSGMVSMLRQVLAAGSRRDRIRWFCDSLAFATLSGRERASGSGFIIDGFQACGLPVDVAEGMPANSLLCMDPASITVVLWGPGILVRANPYAGSATGAVRFDCHVGMDVLIPVPGRIAKSTSVS